MATKRSKARATTRKPSTRKASLTTRVSRVATSAKNKVARIPKSKMKNAGKIAAAAAAVVGAAMATRAILKK